MRLRLKKHLDERLDEAQNMLRPPKTNINAKQAALEPTLIDFADVFGNDNAVYMEIGCGMGGFATQFGQKYPDRNLLAVEKISNVIVVACEKAQDVSNVRFLTAGAEYLKAYIPLHSLDGIFLNFSTPFQKNTYANRRLTHPKFLKTYADLLKKGGAVFQKTDNDDFFVWSKQQFAEEKWQIFRLTDDLHSSPWAEDNICTEYENKFVSLGNKIHYLAALPPE